MQNLKIENRFLINENKKQIKKIWLNNFLDDDENTVDLFLKNVFKNKKGVGAFLNNELIAMILFLNSKVIFKNIKINSIYFYAVCTEQNYRNQGVMRSLFEFAKEKAKEQGAEICFLVPENESLFKMYEKFSFERNINFTKECVLRNESDIKNTMSHITDFCYNDYLKFRLQESEKTPVVILNEKEFNFVFDKTREDVSFLFLKTGYAVFEKVGIKITVSEICGNKNDLLSWLFSFYSDVSEIEIFKYSEKEKNDFGMTCSLVGNFNLTNIYFGMPYR
ncbi:MAG: GNAT family N-acetyltransferase [Ruminococcaceae bacterium]|nr:GNAT family N-acetyltransferase [Oscillospiraceae bacterium]